MMRIVIIDDEPLACERIRTLLAAEKDVEIAGEFHDGRAAVDAIRKLTPDLIFLDVQMPEMDGFAVLRELDASHFPVVIFVTAYDNYALKAFEVSALDYLLKPFDRERFQQALERGRKELARGKARNAQRLVIKSGGRVLFLRAQEIDFIEAQGNYVLLHAAGHQYLHRETMSRMEAMLDAALFTRIHRSTIVNMERIKELTPLFRGDYTVILRGGQKLTLGKAYRERLKL